MYEERSGNYTNSENKEDTEDDSLIPVFLTNTLWAMFDVYTYVHVCLNVHTYQLYVSEQKHFMDHWTLSSISTYEVWTV